MTANQLREKYLTFFKNQGHSIIPSAPLVPQNDPTTLFTSSGMQPLVPYLLGEDHPEGKRIVDSQKSFRAEDIDEVGDNRHTTLFEMLGNWSLGDYFKEEQLGWFFKFLTEEIKLDPSKLYVTVFAGDSKNDVARDTESVAIWKKLFKEKGIEAKDVEIITEELGYEKGMQGGRIFYYEAKKNWWSRSGVPEKMPIGEPGGPDSEVFYEFSTVAHDPKYGKYCHPNCDCGRFLEIGNSVFMQYKKTQSGFEKLPKQNVDFGGGFERILAAMNNDPDVFNTDLFKPLIEEICKRTNTDYNGVNQIPVRIIADHLRASVFLINDGVYPSNKTQGYFLRRLIRRAIVKYHQLAGKLELSDLESIIDLGILSVYEGVYFDKKLDQAQITEVISEESKKFAKALEKGLRQIEKLDTQSINGKVAFDLFQTYGFPLEITEELMKQKGLEIDKDLFRQEFKKHQELSRTSSSGMFKGGLADQSEATTKLHTATHLLHKALQNHLGSEVRQEGSHITAERLRFDFAYSGKISIEQLNEIESEINQQIKAALPVIKTIEDKESALKSGATAFFREKYPDKVSVYTIGQNDSFYSKEFCGGPHVENTQDIGNVKVTKLQSIGANKKRIYAEIV